MNCHLCGKVLGDDGTEIQCHDCGNVLFVECEKCEDNPEALYSGLAIIEKHGCHTAGEAVTGALNQMIDGA